MLNTIKIIFIDIYVYKKLWWSERQLSGSEHWLFIQRTGIQFSGPHGGSKPCVTPVLRDLILSSSLYILIRYRHTGNTRTHIKDFLKRLRKERKETTATSLQWGLPKRSTLGSKHESWRRDPQCWATCCKLPGSIISIVGCGLWACNRRICISI